MMPILGWTCFTSKILDMNKIAAVLTIIIAAATIPVAARDLVILSTNDTHSLIDPDAEGRGGVLQRKAVIDSVRKVNKNVIVVDAGDKVQGTLYFKFFKGEVEYPIQNMLGVDISILGNHEFDNGFEALAKNESVLKSDRLSANYDFTGTPAEGLYKPYVIRKIDGKKIGFFGINIDPKSIIAYDNYKGMGYRDAVSTADSISRILKHEKKCDLVVAVTHIGYANSNEKATDVDIAHNSRDIDIIIGGHSHTLIDPANPGKHPSLIPNADGRPVLVVQSGKSGRYVGEIHVDLDQLGKTDPSDFRYSLIPVTDRFPEKSLDPGIRRFLAPYAEALDSINKTVVGYSAIDFINKGHTGAFPNWTADFGQWYGNLVLDSLRRENPDIPRLDFSIMNVGGIRNPIRKGNVTMSNIYNTFPFSNKYVIMEISGKDILDVFRVAASKGGEAVSREVMVVSGPDRKIRHALVDMKEIDPERKYIVGTIDYVAWGNDDMTSMANGKWLFTDKQELCVPVMRYVKELASFGIPLSADPSPRFIYEDVTP